VILGKSKCGFYKPGKSGAMISENLLGPGEGIIIKKGQWHEIYQKSALGIKCGVSAMHTRFDIDNRSYLCGKCSGNDFI